MFGVSVPIGHADFDELTSDLAGYDAYTTIAAIAGLLSVPGYQAATLRIELLLHLACAHCRGSDKPSLRDLKRWLGHALGDHPVSGLEDPAEDVFVSNVFTGAGNFRLFEGTWESSDFAVQSLLDCLNRTAWGGARGRTIRRSINALLRLSDEVAERSGLGRWAAPESAVPDTKFIRSWPTVRELTRRVTFSLVELESLGVAPGFLDPFLLQPDRRDVLLDEVLGHSTLERFPVIRFEDSVVLACPTAVSPAIRRFILGWADDGDELTQLGGLLRRRHRDILFGDVTPALVTREESWADPPEIEPFEDPGLPVDLAVASIDRDKLAVIALVHDDLAFRLAQGLSVPSGPDTVIAEELAGRVATLAEAGFRGLMLIVWAGIGGGRICAFPELPDGWYGAGIGLADLEMYSRTFGASFLRLWKLEDQLERVQNAGVTFVGFPALLNQYAYWEDQGFRLVPREVAYPAENTAISVPPDMLRGLRLRERRRVDRHLASSGPSGESALVERLHRHTFFRALSERPVYASPELARHGELLAVVKHPALTICVRSERPEVGPVVSDFLFRIWQALRIGNPTGVSPEGSKRGGVRACVASGLVVSRTGGLDGVLGASRVGWGARSA